MSEWTTLYPKELLARFGVAEAHGVYFAPDDDKPGPRVAVSLLVPEQSPAQCEALLRLARTMQARVGITCSTAEQAAAMARKAEKILRHHRRVAIERAVYGTWGRIDA